MTPGADELEALARKYRTLVALRARRDQAGNQSTGAPPPDRASVAALRALAREFPGCLRELDTLGADELARRATCAEQAVATGAAHEPWMAWIAGYHRLMRVALEIRRRGRGPERPDADDGVEIDGAFAAEVTAPPSGRIGIVVLRRLSHDFGVPAREIAATLFPVRRPSPYDL